MLINMHVKNLALISEADIDFYEGLNILTGETGAGKSIIIGSMNLALGEKIPKEMIKNPQEPAIVELVFQVERTHTLEALQQLEITAEEGCVILSRKIVNGRSIAKINGETVPVSKMKAAASLLIDIHGQHEHESLLNSKKHLTILDDFAGEDAALLKRELDKQYKIFSNCKRQLEEMNLNEEERLREISFLEYEIREIEDAALQDGEDEQLEESYKRMLHGKKIMEALLTVQDLVSEGSSNASDEVGQSVRELTRVSSYDKQLQGLLEQLEEIESLLGDFSRELSGYMLDLEFEEEDFYTTEQRLDEINHLKDKYGSSIAEIKNACLDRQQKLEFLQDYEAKRQQASKNLETASREMETLCGQLTSLRKKYAVQLEQQLCRSLEDLNFNEVQFQISFAEKSQFSANGWDEIEFMISTNPGEPMKSLSKVASGGELSRIMLAIKTVMAGKDEIETLIFDEIDSGISGRTAQKVSEKMNVISKNHQILCITHLPQIAAMADAHFLIEKTVKNKVTETQITPLAEDEMVTELARMLGGVEITDAVLKNAAEMKKLAKKISVEKNG
jgi:DNA repair protein RecN (Recombination protein N)